MSARVTSMYDLPPVNASRSSAASSYDCMVRSDRFCCFRERRNDRRRVLFSSGMVLG